MPAVGGRKIPLFSFCCTIAEGLGGVCSNRAAQGLGNLSNKKASEIEPATALALLTGFALLTRQPWGRTLAIVAGILTLIRLPVGTALGIYTLWVLAPAASGAEYEEIAARG